MCSTTRFVCLVFFFFEGLFPGVFSRVKLFVARCFCLVPEIQVFESSALSRDSTMFSLFKETGISISIFFWSLSLSLSFTDV